jgi:hypothetical protein
VRQVGVGAVIVVALLTLHLCVLGIGIVLSYVCTVGLHLLLERERIGHDAKRLLQLPTTRLPYRFGSADGLGQHKCTYDSQKLDKSHGQSSGCNQHGTLLDDVVEAGQASILEELHALGIAWSQQLATRIGHDGFVVLGVIDFRPVIGRINAAAFQLKKGCKHTCIRVLNVIFDAKEF